MTKNPRQTDSSGAYRGFNVSRFFGEISPTLLRYKEHRLFNFERPDAHETSPKCGKESVYSPKPKGH